MDKDFDLDALLAEAAETRASPSPELAARILQDAVRLQPKPTPWPQAPVRNKVSETPTRGAFGWFLGIADLLGGGRAVAGLSLAAMTGLYLGAAQPDLVLSLTSALSGDTATVEQIDLLPATGALWTEN